MSGSPHPEAAVRSKVGRRSWLSPIWAIPIVTVLIAGYLVWHEYSARGPDITLSFHSAEGLTAGQSSVKLRDVTVGTVQTIALAPDNQSVVIGVRMNKEAEGLLTQDARFWVVKPRLFAGSISGLDTLISGSYIQIAPGKPGTPKSRSFIGLEDPPLLQADEQGGTVLVKSARLGSISVGSPVFFRDLTVGEVLGWDVADMAEYVTLHVFVRAPYDKYLREGSRFWNASGVSIKLGAEGVQVQLESVRALLLGGIAFETTEAARKGSVDTAGITFTLYENQAAAQNAAVRRRVPALSYFTDSVSGLAPGAAVVFQGVRIGEVLGYDLEYDPKTDSLRIPVRYEIEPDRIAASSLVRDRGPLENAKMLVKQGLRARLASANLLTGQQQISLDMVADAPPAEIEVHNGTLIFPSAPGQFAGILDAVNQVLAKVEEIPFKRIGDNLNNTLAGVDALVRGPEIKQALVSLRTTLVTVQDVAKKLDQAATPALKELPAVINNLQNTITSANRTLLSVGQGYGADSQFHRDLDRLLEQLTAATRSIRTLTDQLNRNPEALIRGRATQGP